MRLICRFRGMSIEEDVAAIVELRTQFSKTSLDKSQISESTASLARKIVEKPASYQPWIVKFATQILFLSNPKPPQNWSELSTFIDDCAEHQFVAFVRLLAKGKCDVGQRLTPSYILFVDTLLAKCSKVHKKLAEVLDAVEYDKIRRYLVFSCLAICETDDHDRSSQLKGLVKMFSSGEEKLAMRNELINNFPLDVVSNVFLVGLLCDPESTHSREDNVLLNHIVIWADSQDLSAASTAILKYLISNKNHSKKVLLILVDCLIANKSSIRSNALRAWLSRASSSEVWQLFFIQLMNTLQAKWKGLIEKKDVVWPPTYAECEAISCIDAKWNWHETDDMLFLRDRVLSAYLSLSSIALKKFNSFTIDKNNQLIIAGTLWVLSEIRLQALNLMKSMPDSRQTLELFLNTNKNSMNQDLSKAILKTAQELKIDLGDVKIDEKQESDQHKKLFMPSNVEMYQPEKPPDSKVTQRIHFLLTLGGSTQRNVCPPFPRLYANLDQARIHHRMFAKQIVDLQDQLYQSSFDGPHSKLMWMWNSITKCRMKATVDNGCDLMEKLFEENKSMIPTYFERAIQTLSDPSSTIRTLSLSRVLWSCCYVQPQLFDVFWRELILKFLDDETPPTTLSKVLKTFKLFVSKSECEIFPDVLNQLFWYCIDIQNHDDFLVRSSATILFGFLVKRVSFSHVKPLFVFIARHADIWNELSVRLSSSNPIMDAQKVLILSFLSHFSLCDEIFYSFEDRKRIETMRNWTKTIQTTSPDVRIRRFCIDVQLLFTNESERVNKNTDAMKTTSNSNADVEYEKYMIEEMNFVHTKTIVNERRELPTDFHQSPYMRQIERAWAAVERWKETKDEEEIRQKIDSLKSDTIIGHELSCQSSAIILTILANGISDKRISQELAQSFLFQCLRLLSSDLPTVTHLLSRIPVQLGISQYFLQDVYLEKALRTWADNCHSGS